MPDYTNSKQGNMSLNLSCSLDNLFCISWLNTQRAQLASNLVILSWLDWTLTLEIMKFNLFVHSHGYTDRPVNLEILDFTYRKQRDLVKNRDITEIC